MFRLYGPELEAIGKEARAPPPSWTAAKRQPEGGGLGHLKTCYDPEIPVNIVELGLVHTCEVKPRTTAARRSRCASR